MQFWFFFAMNVARWTFGGVDGRGGLGAGHCLPAGSRRICPGAASVAFSSHDQVGDDLRRNCDDPDLEWQDTHPVVFTALGRIQGPACLGSPGHRRAARAWALLAALRHLSQLPCHGHARARAPALGIPSSTTARATGPGVGPEQG